MDDVGEPHGVGLTTGSLGSSLEIIEEFGEPVGIDRVIVGDPVEVEGGAVGDIEDDGLVPTGLTQAVKVQCILVGFLLCFAQPEYILS